MYCPRCAVRLADDAPFCPLCGTSSVPELPLDIPTHPAAYPPSQAIGIPGASGRPAAGREAGYGMDDLTASERGRIAVELLSVALGIALAVTILADLFSAHRLTWSLYSSVGICMAWLLSAIPILFHRHPWVVFSILAPSLVILVFLLDIFDGRLDWFLRFGAPIVLLLEACSAACGALIVAMKRKGLNIIAVLLAGVSVFCFGIETVVDLNAEGFLSPSWSVVVAFAMVPMAGILFYLHYRIVHRASLRKLFRL